MDKKFNQILLIIVVLNKLKKRVQEYSIHYKLCFRVFIVFLQEDYLPESESDDEDDFIDDLPEVISKKDRKPRASVSAEVFGAHNRREDYKPRVIPKDDE